MGIVGKCEQMCSESEILMRQQEGLLHFLEIREDTARLKHPAAEHQKVVKCFSRSAAGRDDVDPLNLRTPKALQKTINYLFYDVASAKTLPWHKIYDFIADRLLAVRQDMVIQQIPRCYGVSLLQPIVKFYAYAAYRLCESSISEFDPVLNKKHCLECLKRLLVLYDEFDHLEQTVVQLQLDREFDYNEDNFEMLFKESRQLFEALYILFNLGIAECINRGLTIPEKWRSDLVTKALTISICMRNGNWIRLCRLMVDLPPLLAGVVSLHLPEIRRKTLEKMSIAYHSKNLTYPIDVLQKVLLYTTKSDVLRDCLQYSIECTEKDINFNKINFDSTAKTVQARKEKFVVEKFFDMQPSVVLDIDCF